MLLGHGHPRRRPYPERQMTALVEHLLHGGDGKRPKSSGDVLVLVALSGAYNVLDLASCRRLGTSSV